jgi:hypothetical protein
MADNDYNEGIGSRRASPPTSDQIATTDEYGNRFYPGGPRRGLRTFAEGVNRADFSKMGRGLGDTLSGLLNVAGLTPGSLASAQYDPRLSLPKKDPSNTVRRDTAAKGAIPSAAKAVLPDLFNPAQAAETPASPPPPQDYSGQTPADEATLKRADHDFSGQTLADEATLKAAAASPPSNKGGVMSEKFGDATASVGDMLKKLQDFAPDPTSDDPKKRAAAQMFFNMLHHAQTKPQGAGPLHSLSHGLQGFQSSIADQEDINRKQQELVARRAHETGLENIRAGSRSNTGALANQKYLDDRTLPPLMHERITARIKALEESVTSAGANAPESRARKEQIAALKGELKNINDAIKNTPPGSPILMSKQEIAEMHRLLRPAKSGSSEYGSDFTN